MSEDAAILAQFSDWRTVKGRKVLQLIFEVPLEDQAKVLTHLGAPMPMADLWCGIARVARKGKAGDGHVREVLASPSEQTPADSGAGAVQYKSPATNSITLVEGETGGAPRALSAAPPVSKSKRRWSEMPPSQRAALILKHEMFEEFARKFGMGAIGETPEGWLKAKLQIKQKRELDLDESRFQRTALAALEGQFMAFCQARGHGVI